MKVYSLLILIFPFYCFSQFKMPASFAEFIRSPASGRVMKRIVADFDQDQKNDVMTVIYQTESELHSGRKYLIVYLTSKNKTFYIDFDLFNGVFVVPLKYKNNVLEFLVYQEGTGLYGHGLKLRFNKKVKEIQLIGYDYSYRTPGGHCNKTYNLLNGDYSVINDFYNLSSKKTEYETFKGTKKIARSIFVKDFSSNLFENLSIVGRKYERP